MRKVLTLQPKASFLRWIGAFIFVLICQCFSFYAVGGVAFAQTQEIKKVKEASISLDQARADLEEIQKKLKSSDQRLDDKQLNGLRDRLNTLKVQATTVEESLAPSVESSKARLAELGQLDPDLPEAGDLKKQRDTLNKEVANLDGQLKIARLISVEVKQSLEDLGALRRQQFQAVLSQRFLSPLSSSSRAQIKENLMPDLRSAQQAFYQIKVSVEHVSIGMKWLLVGIATLWVLILLYAWQRFLRYLLTRSQPTRLRRTLLATMLVGLYVLIPTGMLAILFSILTNAQGLSDEHAFFVQHFLGVVALAAFIAGLGRALLSPNKPTWRLPSLSDPVARALRWLPLALGLFIITLWTIQKVTDVVSSSISTLLLINSIFSLGLNVIVGLAVWRAEKIYRVEGKLELETPLATSLHSLALKAVTFAILSSIVAWFFGYIALSNFIIQEVVWLGVILFTTYLLFCLFGDVADGILNSFKEELKLEQISERQQRTRSQIILLLTGLFKILLLLLALTLIFLPFGEDPVVWLHRRLTLLMQGFTFGEVIVKPTAFLYAGIVLVVGLWIVQSLQRWLADKYLPYTGLDQGMGASTARLISYLGYVIAVVLALSTAGIGFERMAWIISALSVGIGFGLQAVVQNFVSGLLLLAERPIKVGDWITIGTDIEGNVRQINARATEIEMFDKSTVIVPNSELITKTVRNVTLSEPMGRGRITVIMPVNVSAEIVRQCLFEAAESTEEVLTDPEPLVIIDGFESGGIAYSLYIYLPSPRLVNAIRSEVFFKVLANFERLELSLHPTQRMEMVGATITNSEKK